MMIFPFLNRVIQVDQNKPALIRKDIEISYSELNTRIDVICRMLKARGIRKNSRVAMSGSHDVDFILLLLAIWRIGAIPIPLNTRLNDNEKRKLLELSSPVLFIRNNNLHEKDQYIGGFSIENTVYDYKEYHPGIVIFTSGTTGIPKGVVLTLNNLITSADITNKILKPDSNDTWLASLPFYHIGGIMIIVRAFTAGLSIMIPDSFDPEETAFCLREFRPAFISLVPTSLKRLIDNNVFPNPEMKYVLLGGGPVKDDLANEAISKGWEILKVYGSSETCSMFTALNISKDMNKLSSAGHPLEGNLIKIVNEKREELSIGEIGEISVSGPTLFREYLNNAVETRNKLEDQFFFTGDIGYLDEDGYLFIQSRRTDLIISGGENISPQEIEDVLLKITDIQQACVFGMADEEWGQVPVAVIKTTGLKDPERIINYLRRYLAAYKLPKKIYFLDELPVNALGKTNKEQLKNLLD